MRNPVASFIIPVYKPNPEHFRTMLASVVRVARYYGPAEILLYDDASPDGAATLLEEARRKAPDLIRTLGTKTNGGIGKARCVMTAESRGRYVISFDQDDVMLPFDLRGLIEFLDANPHYCASYARKFLFNDRGLTGEVHGADISCFSAFFTPKININAMLIRKSDLLRHDSFRPLEGSSINDDVFLMIRFAEDSDFHYDVRPRTLYRVHARQNSHIYIQNNKRDFAWMAHYLTEKYHDWYERILRLDPPQLTQENHRVIKGLIGLGVFLNQRNSELASALCRLGIRICPDDYGAWEHALLIEACKRNPKSFDALYAEATEHFKNSASKYPLFSFAAVAVRNALQYSKTAPNELLAQLNALRGECWRIPDIVLDHMPPLSERTTVRPAYSLANRGSAASCISISGKGR